MGLATATPGAIDHDNKWHENELLRSWVPADHAVGAGGARDSDVGPVHHGQSAGAHLRERGAQGAAGVSHHGRPALGAR